MKNLLHVATKHMMLHSLKVSLGFQVWEGERLKYLGMSEGEGRRSFSFPPYGGVWIFSGMTHQLSITTKMYLSEKVSEL